ICPVLKRSRFLKLSKVVAPRARGAGSKSSGYSSFCRMSADTGLHSLSHNDILLKCVEKSADLPGQSV
ncbi:MAG: hypothetical protein K6E83_08640, partial [Clostridium sp.]|nr:hypothetical protein [Clostridium sp.]